MSGLNEYQKFLKNVAQDVVDKKANIGEMLDLIGPRDILALTSSIEKLHDRVEWLTDKEEMTDG